MKPTRRKKRPLTYGEIGRGAWGQIKTLLHMVLINPHYNTAAKQNLIAILEEQLEIVRNSEPKIEADPSEIVPGEFVRE